MIRDVGDYTVGKVLGRGTSSVVHQGEHKASGTKVALKICNKDNLSQEQVQKQVQSELQNQRDLNHRHVLKMKDFFDFGDSICVVLEYAPNGDLFDYMLRHQRLKEPEANRIFRQLIEGVAHCHQNMVVHRDLKPENILMDEQFNVKIADFGLSGQWSPGGRLTESCGSPNYAAPEVVSKGATYEGPEIDVWSCGVVLYVMLCGFLPFDDENIPGLFRKIKAGRYEKFPGHVSKEAKDLISRMLTVDQAARITLSRICEHPWFKQEDAVSEPRSCASVKSKHRLKASASCRGARAGSGPCWSAVQCVPSPLRVSTWPRGECAWT
jgi:serine/threonine protein kinase